MLTARLIGWQSRSPRQVFRAQSEPEWSETVISEPLGVEPSLVTARNADGPLSDEETHEGWTVQSEPEWNYHSAASTPFEPVPPRGFFPKLIDDHRQFYSRNSLLALGVGFGAGAAMANTNFDQEVHDHYQDEFRSDASNRASRILKKGGEGIYVIPLVAGAAIWGALPADLPGKEVVGEWGSRSTRSLAVGGPFMLLMQNVTGGTRPNETPKAPSSHWNFFADNNGVSGHAFVGAVPLMAAAQMTDDPLLKGSLYAASTITAFTRINDGAHYFSQAVLGWWVAYVATVAVNATETGNQSFSILPIPVGNGLGIGIEFRR